eukprot:3002181-Pyramimonas_sp.AAC.1
MAQASAALSATVRTTYDQLSKRMEVRMAQTEQKLGEHDSKIQKLEEQVQHLLQVLGEVRADKPTAKIRDTAFDRDIDPTIILIRSKGLLARQNMLNGIQSWLDR